MVDNTPDEINEVVLEMLDQLRGAPSAAPDASDLRHRFTALLPDADPQGIAQIGGGFLRRHRDLLN